MKMSENDSIITCPECGQELSKLDMACPKCGFPIGDQRRNTTQIHHQKKKAIAGITMCLIAIACIIFSITRITDYKYLFYVQHYQECIDGYLDAKEAADSNSYSLYKYSYDNLLNRWQDMIDEDKKIIWTYRYEAIGFGCLGTIMIILGIRLLIQSRGE